MVDGERTTAFRPTGGIIGLSGSDSEREEKEDGGRGEDDRLRADHRAERLRL